MRAARASCATADLLIEYAPSAEISRTIEGGPGAGADACGAGTWTSIDFRMLGIAAMKMISSTRSTSIIGVTLISFVSAGAKRTGRGVVVTLLTARA